MHGVGCEMWNARDQRTVQCSTTLGAGCDGMQDAEAHIQHPSSRKVLYLVCCSIMTRMLWDAEAWIPHPYTMLYICTCRMWVAESSEVAIHMHIPEARIPLSSPGDYVIPMPVWLSLPYLFELSLLQSVLKPGWYFVDCIIRDVVFLHLYTFVKDERTFVDSCVSTKLCRIQTVDIGTV